MAKAAMGDQADSEGESQSQSYAPSWIDRLTGWVGRLPGYSWLYYLGIGLVVLLVEVVVTRGEGILPLGTVLPMRVFMAGVTAYFPALLYFLDSRASAALATLRPALKTGEGEYDDVHFRLTTLPAWPTLVAGLATTLFSILLDGLSAGFTGNLHIFEDLGTASISYWLSYSLWRLLWWLFGTLFYHTYHQLREIDRIYTRYTHIDLFRRGPLYAFSGVAALTAVGLAIPPYGFLALYPGLLSDPITIGVYVVITALLVVTFLWPLRGAHRLLAREKTQVLDEISLRFEAAMVELLRRVDSGELEGIGDLNTAIAALEMERNAVHRIPTWPWQPDTVRLLITALALPLGLWITQYILQSLLSSQ